MSNLDAFFGNIGNFSVYFAIGVLLLIVFKGLYTMVTPINEWKLIKEQQSTAAAIGLGGAILGFAIALSGVISNSVSLVDFLSWSVVALLAQLIAFIVVRFTFLPKIVERIEQGQISAAVILASTNISVGLINAASMTY